MEIKTNVMRLLDTAKATYQSYQYPADTALSGVEVANALGLPPHKVFKTLVTVGKSKRNHVFMIPVEQELNLKKAALASGEKAIEMIKAKELLSLTGYVHGGCSPIGMKKLFSTFLDASARELSTIVFSGGKIGTQVEMSVDTLRSLIPLQLVNLT